jgi:PEP-CTERM motif
MRVMKMAAAMPVAVALAWGSPLAAATTVNATVNSFASALTVNWTVVRSSGNIVQAGVLSSRMNATTSGGSYSYPLLGGSTPGGFVAFCIEPMEFLPIGTGKTYNVTSLSRAASGLGGIGITKANRIRELFGRFAATNGGYGSMTALNSVAFQLAIWEIVMETPGNALNVLSTATNKGNFYAARTQATSAAFLSANLWLSQLNGTGPLAKGLVVLQNGTFGVQGSGSQDLLAFAAVPEPASWAMLIAGFGLVGASLRRRRAAVAA